MTGSLAPSGYILLADVSGYTMFLTTSELEHARDIMSDLLEKVVAGTKPPLQVSKLEGDAVLSYGMESAILGGQTLIEMIEECYVGFRRAIERMVLNNTCKCNACTNISNLDLKFFVHHGEFALQQVGDRQELFGPTVILAHRLLKNDIKEATGIAAYTAYTGAAIEQMGRELVEGMHSHRLHYEDVGEVEIWIEDMRHAWEASRKENLINLAAKEILMEESTEFGLPPETVWSYLTDPEFRKTFMAADSAAVSKKSAGRVAEGTVFHCYHGGGEVPQEVVEWRPFERMVTHDSVKVMGATVKLYSIYELAPTEDGTRMTVRFGRLTGPKIQAALAKKGFGAQRDKMMEDSRNFKERIEADYLARVKV
jgi:uncharacterized protein YndB with AHSA1/START domain